MRYLLLLTNDARDVERWRTLSREDAQREREEEIPRWNELFEWLGEQGLQTDGLELDDADTGRVVKMRDGRAIVSDGPYAETKELLGGFFVVDCPDLDQAIEIASRIPVAERGSVEIRPLLEPP